MCGRGDRTDAPDGVAHLKTSIAFKRRSSYGGQLCAAAVHETCFARRGSTAPPGAVGRVLMRLGRVPGSRIDRTTCGYFHLLPIN